MRKLSCSILTLGATAVTALGMTACGSSDEVVARVGKSTISKETLDHWIPIEATTVYELYPKKAVPKGVVPDPPEYAACIAYLKATPRKNFTPGPVNSTPRYLKAQCKQQYDGLRQYVLNFLIAAQWVTSEDVERGVTVSDAEVKRWYEKTIKVFLPKEAEVKKFFAITGESESDQLFRARVHLLSAKLEQQLLSNALTPQQKEQALANFTREFPRKWVARTSCRSGYIVPNCRQYRGPRAPEIGI